MTKIRFFYLLIIWLAAGCTDIEFSEIPDYPITLEPLGLLELDALNEDYISENANYICSTLNEYGLTGFSRVLFPNDVNPCNNRTVVRVKVENPDSLIDIAKNVLVKNVKYTNVKHTNELEVIDVLPLYGCTICEGPNTNSVPLEWKITFGEQVIEGIKVYDSRITVFVDALGVNRIWGNWYSDFYAPSLFDVGYIQAQSEVVGTSVELSTITGQDTTLTITEEMLMGTPSFEIVPHKNVTGMIEIRKTWAIVIDYKFNQNNTLVAFVDVVDGQMLSVVSNLDNY